MTPDSLMDRLRSADPATDAAPIHEREELFARLVAEPGDGRLDAAPRRRGRRSRRRMRVAIPALALVAGAAAAAVVVVDAGSGPGSGGSGPAAVGPVVSGNDAAFVVRRVRATLAATDQGDVDVWVQSGGNGNPGSNSSSTTSSYTDPQTKVFHQSSILRSADGAEIYAQYIVGTPHGASMDFQTTAIDPQQHLYAVSSDDGSAYGSTSGDADQIRQQLASGQATEDGTATIDGQPTIKLTFPTAADGWSSILYVNAQTYAPVLSTSASSPDAQGPTDTTDVSTETWQPADETSIAQTELGQIPDGFTQVSVAALHQANPAGR